GARGGGARAGARELRARGPRHRAGGRVGARGARGAAPGVSRDGGEGGGPGRAGSRAARVSTVFVSAGEPSGDAHAAALVSALRQADPTLGIEGVGGPALAAAGAQLLARIENLTVIGFAEVLAKVP